METSSLSFYRDLHDLDDFAFEIAVKTEKKPSPCLQNFNSGVPARHRLRL